MNNFSEFLIAESIQELDEALGGLADVPKQWLSSVTKAYGHKVGDGSTVQVIGTGAGVRSEGGLRNVIKDGISKVHKGEYEFCWVELENKPILGFAGANGYGSDQVRIYTDSGALVTATKRVQTEWSGKYAGSGKNRRWVAPEYMNVTDKSFKVMDAAERAIDAIISVLLPEGASRSDVQWKGVNLTVKVLTADDARRLKQNDRKDARPAKKSDRLSPEAATALKKAVQVKTEVMVKEIVAALPDSSKIQGALDAAAEGKWNSKTHSFRIAIPTNVEQSIQDLNSMLSDFSDVVRNGGKGYKGWDDKNVPASYSLKGLMSKLK